MAIETVAVTGGNGKIGRAIIEDLNGHGYRTVDLARGKRREDVSDEYLTTDLLDAGEVYGSLAKSRADAVVHMGTIPAPSSHPGYVTYESNVMTSYHVLEAATELGLEAACLASSINAMGVDYEAAPAEVVSPPVDEDHPLTPRDPYAIGKRALEVTAAGFGRQPNHRITISTLRYPWVATTEELRTNVAEADHTLDALTADGRASTRDALFSYLHVDDAAAIARRAIEAEYEGHETFWAVAADTSTRVASERLAEEFYPDATLRRSLDGCEALIDIGKARRLLDWEPARSWRER